MRKILVGTAVALFTLAPAMSWADCSDAHSASMASSTPVPKPELAQTPAASKAPTPVVAKTSVTKQVKQVGDKPTSPSKADGSTVVAKTN